MITGVTWKFGNNINTDLMMPGHALYASEAAQARLVFSANRPGWVDQLKPGDILIAGENFGTGSGRPAARSLKTLGLACVVAESFNGLFFRSCVSYGLIGIECPGVHSIFNEGDIAEISLETFMVRNAGTGQTLPAVAIIPALLDVMCNGGTVPRLEAAGLVSPPLSRPLS